MVRWLVVCLKTKRVLHQVVIQHELPNWCDNIAVATLAIPAVAACNTTTTSQTGIMEDDADMASMHNSTGRASAAMGPMGPPLSRTWLLQQQQSGCVPVCNADPALPVDKCLHGLNWIIIACLTSA